MSFESKMKKRGNKNLNKFAKNPYHKSWFARIPIWTKVLVPSALAAGLIIGVFIGVLPNMTSKASANMKVGESGYNNTPASITPASEPGKGDYSIAPGAASSTMVSSYQAEPSYTSIDEHKTPWSSKNNLDRYPYLTYNEQNYRSWQHNPLDADAIKGKVDDVTLIGQEETKEGIVNHEIDAEIFTVRNMSNDVAYALKFEGEEYYYPYIAETKGFDTIGDLLNRCAFDEEVDIYRATYNSTSDQQSFTNVSKEKIKELLFDDLSIVGTAKSSLIGTGSYKQYVYFRFRINSLKLECSFSLFETGVFEVNALGVIDRFSMNAAKYAALTDYLLNNTSAL